MLNLDRHFFPVFDHLDMAAAYPGTYNPWLVATSLAIAILAAFIALSISVRVSAAKTPGARYAWVSGGAISMGGGIWSMHFVGMLAFSLPCGIAYDLIGTVLSIIPGVLASGVALAAISKPDGAGLGRRFVTAVLMGAGIAAMHYSGMAAMWPEALLRYSPGLVVISIVVAVALAFVSLSIRFQFHRPQSSRMPATIIAALVMGCAVAGMHYTAMQAAIFFPLPNAPSSSMALSPPLLALLITMFTVLIAVGTLVASFAGRQSELATSLSAEICRRKRTEEDLRRSEAYLTEAQRLSHTGSWAFNITTRQIVHSSEEHHRLFGFDPKKGVPVWEDWIRRLHPEDRQRTIETVEQRICDRADFEMDYRTVHPDGTIKYIHVIGHPVLNASSDLVEFTGTAIDMTERKQAEEARLDAQHQLAHANRVTTMGQLTAAIAHEVNQPIAAAVTNAQAAKRWLRAQPPDLSEAAEALDRIVASGNRASDVIRRIRALVKKAPARMGPIDINDTISEVIALTRYELQRHNVALHTRLATNLPRVRGDRVQLAQVILNFVVNAIDAMKTGDEWSRELLVASESDTSDTVLVSVRDSGPGLSPESDNHVFEPFYTTKPDGMGMGLSICRSIIEAHSGQLWASANAPRGALFQFTVPAHPDTAAPTDFDP